MAITAMYPGENEKRKSRRAPFHASLRKMISHLKSVKTGLG
jgi:hypothetical protein